MFDAERNGWLDGRVIGFTNQDFCFAHAERHARLHFGDNDVRLPCECVGMMRKAVADVWRKSSECCINNFLCARRAVNVQRRFGLAHDVVRGDDVVEVGEVVAV